MSSTCAREASLLSDDGEDCVAAQLFVGFHFIGVVERVATFLAA